MTTRTTIIIQKLYADGRIVDCNERMTLKQMQEFVGGYIELCASKLPGKTLIVDDDGGFKQRAANPAATRLVAPGIMLLPGGLTGDCLLALSSSL